MLGEEIVTEAHVPSANAPMLEAVIMGLYMLLDHRFGRPLTLLVVLWGPKIYILQGGHGCSYSPCSSKLLEAGAIVGRNAFVEFSSGVIMSAPFLFRQLLPDR